MKFRLKQKFGDISANFRDTYCPNPCELLNDISFCLKYRGEHSAKMRSSRTFVANFRANFRSVLQAFWRKVQTPWSKYESSFCCAGMKHSRNLFADFSLQSTQPTVLSNSPGYSPWKAELCTQNPKALHFLLLLAWYSLITPCTVYTNTRSFPLSPCKYRVEMRRMPYLFIKLANISVPCKKGIESVMFFLEGS